MKLAVFLGILCNFFATFLCESQFEQIVQDQELEFSHQDSKFLSHRSKRSFAEPFRVPGTRWCGRGHTANNTNHLGPFQNADKCCRYHDTGCPFFIDGMTTKYGLYNWRIYTLNHCACDARFRSCLKMAKSGAANFVGSLFFNIVKTKCFLLRPEKVCTERNWWGKCLKMEVKKQAYLKEPLPYKN